MAMPRCGFPDIINRTTSSMQYNSNSSFHSDYAFYNGNLRWPLTKGTLTYAFLTGTRTDVYEPVRQAFQTWSRHTPFTYQLIDNYDIADIKISFQRLDHGDMDPFDGPGGTLAHSFPPTTGIFHYDGDENWVVGAVQDGLDMGTVALHEIGHILGLAHTPVEAAIMYPVIFSGVTKGLNDDDIQGIKTLYAA